MPCCAPRRADLPAGSSGRISGRDGANQVTLECNITSTVFSGKFDERCVDS